MSWSTSRKEFDQKGTPEEPACWRYWSGSIDLPSREPAKTDGSLVRLHSSVGAMNGNSQLPVGEEGTSLKDRPVLSVVTCVLNEEQVVPELVRRVIESCRPLGVSFEFIVINDGSMDGTLPALIALSQQVPELRIVNLFRRFGHMPALSAGLALARGDAVVVIDGD